MGGGGAAPDIKADADAGGNVHAAIQRAALKRKQGSAQPDRRGLLERIFNPHSSNQQNQQSSGKRPHWPF
jgi:hypothetical protein